MSVSTPSGTSGKRKTSTRGKSKTPTKPSTIKSSLSMVQRVARQRSRSMESFLQTATTSSLVRELWRRLCSGLSIRTHRRHALSESIQREAGLTVRSSLFDKDAT